MRRYVWRGGGTWGHWRFWHLFACSTSSSEASVMGRARTVAGTVSGPKGPVGIRSPRNARRRAYAGPRLGSRAWFRPGALSPSGFGRSFDRVASSTFDHPSPVCPLRLASTLVPEAACQEEPRDVSTTAETGYPSTSGAPALRL